MRFEAKKRYDEGKTPYLLLEDSLGVSTGDGGFTNTSISHNNKLKIHGLTKRETGERTDDARALSLPSDEKIVKDLLFTSMLHINI
jgi:hypothetical protein